ncbi:MAG TPA: 50S ribosomal protein L23 [Candidatus Staskawiczbacteria bacterium]|nr:50S ribosomal protein L23 [Candidatus Staskawiczbacteria bacterium]
MALFDFLKRKKEIEKSKEVRKTAKKPDKSRRHFDGPATISPKANLGGEEKPETVVQKPVARPKKNVKFSYEAITKPHISEKATYLAEKNQYIFVVPVSYNKKEIKNSVEGIYNVDVLSVNKVKIPAKKRRIGATQGFKKGFVKAIVKIKEGQKIEVL